MSNNNLSRISAVQRDAILKTNDPILINILKEGDKAEKDGDLAAEISNHRCAIEKLTDKTKTMYRDVKSDEAYAYDSAFIHRLPAMEQMEKAYDIPVISVLKNLTSLDDINKIKNIDKVNSKEELQTFLNQFDKKSAPEISRETSKAYVKETSNTPVTVKTSSTTSTTYNSNGSWTNTSSINGSSASITFTPGCDFPSSSVSGIFWWNP